MMRPCAAAESYGCHASSGFEEYFSIMTERTGHELSNSLLCNCFRL
jgi:hypothetical protein